MNEREPDWYKRAQAGPFEREPFTEEDMRRIESAILERQTDEQEDKRSPKNGRIRAAVRAARRNGTARISAVAAAVLLLAGGGAYAAMQMSERIPSVPMASGPSGGDTDPSTASVAPPAGVSTFSLGGKSYFYDDSNASIPEWTRAVRTTEGIVWTPAPQMTGSATTIKDMQPGDHPQTPFQLYFSDPNKPQLTERESFMLPGLPLNGRDSSRYWYIDHLWAVGAYAVYTTSVHVADDSGLGREDEQAWVVDTQGLPTTPSFGTVMDVRLLTNFDSDGESPFELSYDETNGRLIYTVEVPPEDGGVEGEELVVAQQLDNGSKVFVERYGIAYGTAADGSRTVDYELDGAVHTAKLFDL